MYYAARGSILRMSLGLAAVAAVGVVARADLTSFQPGTLVLMRGGDASHSQSTFGNGEVPAYLDEYSISVIGASATATFIDTYPIPTTALTLPGILTNSHEGRLERSGNGQFLDFAGYQQPLSSSATRLTNSTGGGGYYQVGQVSFLGAFTNSSLNPAIAKPQFMRGAYSLDGTHAWVASKSPIGGLEFIAGFGSGSPTTVALQSTTDWRDIKVSAGQLYGGTGSSSVGTHGFYAIGTGAQNAGTPGNTLLGPNSDNSASGFAFATLPGGNPITGAAGTPNVVYTVGDPGGSLYIAKLFSQGNPLATSDLAIAGGTRLALTPANYGGTAPEGIVALPDPNNANNIDLFIQASEGIYFGIDASATSTGSISSVTFTKIISNTTDTAFYGIAPAPVPEPASLAVLGTVSATLLIRRRSRKS